MANLLVSVDHQRPLGVTEAILNQASRRGYGNQVNSLLVDAPLDEHRLRQAVFDVQQCHPTLRSRIVMRDGRPWLCSVDQGIDGLEIVDRSTASIDPTLLAQLADTVWLDGAPPWKLVFHRAQTGPHLLTLVSNHALGDGRALLGVLQGVLQSATTTLDVPQRRALPPTIESILSPKTTPVESLIRGALRGLPQGDAWRSSTQTVSDQPGQTVFARDTLDHSTLARLLDCCRRQRVRATSLLTVLAGRSVLRASAADLDHAVMTVDVLFDRFDDVTSGDPDPCVVAIQRLGLSARVASLLEAPVIETARTVQDQIDEGLRVGPMLPDQVDAAALTSIVEYYLRVVAPQVSLVLSNLGPVFRRADSAVVDAHGQVARGGGPSSLLLESITTPTGWHLDWSWDSHGVCAALANSARALMLEEVVALVRD